MGLFSLLSRIISPGQHCLSMGPPCPGAELGQGEEGWQSSVCQFGEAPLNVLQLTL
jgi:hypothetical protein